jgi:hypothetical protein
MLFQRNLHLKKKKPDHNSRQTQHLSSPSDDDIDDVEKKGKVCVKTSLRLYLHRRVPRLVLLLLFAFATRNILYLLQPINSNRSNDGFVSPEPQGQYKPSNHACDGYKGVYHIEKGDIGGAAGTVFFQFVIGQIIWAEEYNFKPWVHLNNVSHVVYDPIVHGNSTGVDLKMLKGMQISYVQRPMGHRKDAYPGPPVENPKGLIPHRYHFDGDGVWNNYFEPITDFIPGDKSCENKPLVTMDLYLVTPGVHGFSGAPKAWRYEYLPDYITKPHIPLNDWLAPQRQSAHSVLKRHIQFLPRIKTKAERVNPYCSIKNSCLGIHIRHSDKAAGRRHIDTDEFLPYVKAFLDAGGKWVYIATDSEKAFDYIKSKWPQNVLKVIRSMGDDVVRSNNLQAVFDIDSHHRTNEEILVEILALSKCQFMIHGLSAVTESSIWINIDLHYTSVNLEDPQHPDENEFGDLVGKVLNGGNASQILNQKAPKDWWLPRSKNLQLPANVQVCDSVSGILHISHVGSYAGTGTAFFTSVLNQLMYADEHNLKPWIHLSDESDYIYDDEVHGKEVSTIKYISDTFTISSMRDLKSSSIEYPGPPAENEQKKQATKDITLRGNGIWTKYFQPVSDFVPDGHSCIGKPILSMDKDMVHNLNSWSPFSSKVWQYDDIPNEFWNPDGSTLKSWLEPMRRKANEVVKKYFVFQPFLVERAQHVNPVDSASVPCLAVHLRNVDDKKGIHREKFPPNKFREYFLAFARAGGKHIYVASDSRRSLDYIIEHFPSNVREMIRTQGSFVVRSSWKWPAHMLEKHHRTNSEALVDVLAMSKCQFLLHGNSAISEAAVYLNLDLHNQSVNWEDPDRLSVEQFEALVKRIVKNASHKSSTIVEALNPSSTIVEEPRIIQGNHNRKCKRNAIVYLAQKNHSSYDRDSFSFLLRSLKLINSNYLSLNDHKNNTDVIIFHTADFTKDDMDIIESSLGSSFRDVLYIIDLYNTSYWQRPSWHINDNPVDWYAYPLFSEGYRQMMHWYAVDIWSFFQDYGKGNGCEYEYIMRLDEDSFLRSPVKYDVFDFMKRNDYNYGFRLCSYEMQVTKRIWKIWRNIKGSPEPVRDIDLEMCGIYNNFFVAKLSFFQSNQVQRFLKLVDRQGMIYRRRLGDLMIHSMAVYAFSPQEKIHRFLDFTYEHSTVDSNTGCVIWGGIQAGYDDPNANTTLQNYLLKKVSGEGCTGNISLMIQDDLSPTYQHLPDYLNGEVQLETIMAGKVEMPGRGLLSG